jgi:hypothetical protein
LGGAQDSRSGKNLFGQVRLALLTEEHTELGDSKSMPRQRRERPSEKKQRIRLTPAANWVLLILWFSIPLVYAAASFAELNGPSEYQIKAAFLYKFAKFIEWPASTFRDPKQPMGICVFGRDPFGHALEEALWGKSIGSRSVFLGRAQQIPELAGCQVVFVSAEESSRVMEIVRGLRGHSALLVGESEGFASSGGAIQFVLDQNRVRFAINPDAANRAGLKISSKLLALATIVRDAGSDAEEKF